ncbi:hypothetical protein GCM10027517_35460 [Phycicoccus ginsengisoli]
MAEVPGGRGGAPQRVSARRVLRACDLVHRGRVTPAEVLALLELRLYRGRGERPPTSAAVVLGCALAAEWNVGAVITPPEHVRTASTTLAHRGPVLVTGLGVGTSPPRPLLAEARDLIRDGAHDLAVTATSSRIEADLTGLVQETTEVAGFATAVGARVRVVVDTEGLARRALLDACEQLAHTGAWLLQGGLWRSALPSFADVKAMRRAIPEHVLLKWTAPMTRVDTLLSCVAAGVDRFSVDDVPGFMAHTIAHAELGPLIVPGAG